VEESVVVMVVGGCGVTAPGARRMKTIMVGKGNGMAWWLVVVGS